MMQIPIFKLLFVSVVITLIVLLPACSSPPPSAITLSATPNPTLVMTKPATMTPAEASGDDSIIGGITTVVVQRTMAPTPTPGPIDQGVEKLTDATGLADKWFLGLWTIDWINLGVSALLILLGILLGILLLFSLIRWVVRRTETQFDDLFLSSIERELKWLVVIVVTRFSILRLKFLSEGLRGNLEDIFFLLQWGLLLIISLRLVAFITWWYREHQVPEENWQRFEPIIEMTKRLVYLLVGIIFLAVGLSHFGIEVTVLSVGILFFILVIAIAAREAIADAVSGFLILLDQPFRVGDDIQLMELNTWGKVVEIGIRITRIRTQDNRQVTIPNSIIGQNQVVNYTYPDPTIRLETDMIVAHETDIDQVKEIVKKAVRGVEGVLPDKPVKVLHLAFFGSARRIRVQWWIDEISQCNRMLDQVNAATEVALAEAAIKLPDPEYLIDIRPNAGSIGMEGLRS